MLFTTLLEVPKVSSHSLISQAVERLRERFNRRLSWARVIGIPVVTIGSIAASIAIIPRNHLSSTQIVLMAIALAVLIVISLTETAIVHFRKWQLNNPSAIVAEAIRVIDDYVDAEFGHLRRKYERILRTDVAAQLTPEDKATLAKNYEQGRDAIEDYRRQATDAVRRDVWLYGKRR